jgi:hypothetical protein
MNSYVSAPRTAASAGNRFHCGGGGTGYGAAGALGARPPRARRPVRPCRERNRSDGTRGAARDPRPRVARARRGPRTRHALLRPFRAESDSARLRSGRDRDDRGEMRRGEARGSRGGDLPRRTSAAAVRRLRLRRLLLTHAVLHGASRTGARGAGGRDPTRAPTGRVVRLYRTGDRRSRLRSRCPPGESLYELDGFVVHFFDRGLVDRLGSGYEAVEVDRFEEGPLPRRLWRVTMRKP